MNPTPKEMQAFKDTVWGYYAGYARDLPWRRTADPYKILLSELMLQQTQVARVIPKYELFVNAFPAAADLAKASVSEVLTMWQGLGYNRRALNLKKTCEQVTKEYGGVFPADREKLLGLPGIGQSTAGAILAFAFNKPSVFIETNIRAVYLYHFFKEASSVSDKVIVELIAQTVDQEKPREWYYALYDYGTMLKAKLGKAKTDVHKQSKHYAKQSKFEGSNRQIRSNILKSILALGANGGTPASLEVIKFSSEVLAEKDDSDILKNLDALTAEGFIVQSPENGQNRWDTAV